MELKTDVSTHAHAVNFEFFSKRRHATLHRRGNSFLEKTKEQDTTIVSKLKPRKLWMMIAINDRIHRERVQYMYAYWLILLIKHNSYLRRYVQCAKYADSKSHRYETHLYAQALPQFSFWSMQKWLIWWIFFKKILGISSWHVWSKLKFPEITEKPQNDNCNCIVIKLKRKSNCKFPFDFHNANHSFQ